MGVDISASIGYGFVFSKEDILAVTDKLDAIVAEGYDVTTFKKLTDQSCFVDALTCAFSAVEVEDSVDCYSGDDYRKEVYIFIESSFKRIGCKGGDVDVFAKDSFKVPEKKLAVLQKELKEIVLLGKEKKEGWILRTYLS